MTAIQAEDDREMEVIPVQGMIPRANDAIANPFVLDVEGAPAP